MKKLVKLEQNNNLVYHNTLLILIKGITMRQYFMLLITSLFMLTACSESAPTQQTSQASPPPESAKPTYRVFSELNYLPFISQTNMNNISGFEYDLLTEIAKRQGFQLTFTPYTWEGLFDTLEKGQSDIVCSGITITDERKQKMMFTDPYFESETVLLTHKDTADIKKFADMKGKKISVQKGTLQGDIVKQHNGIPIALDTSWLAVKHTLTKDSDAALGDYGLFLYLSKNYEAEGLMLIRDPNSSKEQLGFGIKKGNTQLQNKLNQGLQQIKADGTYNRIYQKWFGETAPQQS